MRSVRPVLVVVAVAAALSACAKTNLTNLWKSPDAGAPLQSILVISLERDEEMRRTWEDALASEFMANGVMARPGYSLFPSSLPDSQQVVTVTRRDGYDGVLVTHRLGTSHTEKFSNDYSKMAPGESNNYWRSWYHTHFMQASTMDPFKEGDARFQVDLANAAGRGTLMWTGSTTPVDPRDEEKVRKDVCGELVTELVRRNLVAKRN
jgi:hypothetical protein